MDDMKKKYLILAHKNPIQLQRLVKSLDDENSLFFIHLDLRTDIAPFKERICGENIFFIEERVGCLWGDFSIVLATINLMKASFSFSCEGFSILLSAQCYPIKSKKSIDNFLCANKDFNFIDIENLHDKWKDKMVRDKVENYHILHSSKRGDSNCYAPFWHSNLYDKLRMLFHFIIGRLSYKNLISLLNLPKRTPFFKNQYCGSQWWAFNEGTLSKMIHFIDENFDGLEKYYKYTSSSDEVFFHSVFMYLKSKDGSIKNKPSLTYVNWHRKNCPLPVLFKKEDFSELNSQKDKLFARKFDMDIDSTILDIIDKNLDE